MALAFARSTPGGLPPCFSVVDLPYVFGVPMPFAVHTHQSHACLTEFRSQVVGQSELWVWGVGRTLLAGPGSSLPRLLHAGRDLYFQLAAVSSMFASGP